MLKLNGLTRVHCLTVWVFAVLSLAVLTAPAHAATATFEIEPQDLSGALKAFAVQSHREIFFAPEFAHGRHSQGVKGKFDDLHALNIILEGTGLNFSVTASNAILVRDPTSKSDSSREAGLPASSDDTNSDKEVGKRSSQDFRVARLDQTPAGPQVTEDKKEEKKPALEEIVVTGTHIHGAGSASPTTLITRAGLDQAGIETITELARDLPGNYGGYVNENSLASVKGGQGNNNTAGTGFDIHGLGSDSTLVLLDGNRLAPGNSAQAAYTDVSMIPLGAIERVEIVPDGSSAIYGSDAVSGVVNMILRRNFDGLESKVQYGGVTQGNSDELLADLTMGKVWSNGSALLSYEYYDRSKLQASGRTYTSSAPEPFTLLPNQQRNSIIGTLNESVGSNAEIFGDALYAERNTDSDITSPTFKIHDDAQVVSYSVTAGVRSALSETHRLEISSTYSGVDELTDAVFNGVNTAIRAKPSITSVDGKVDGPIVTLPGGPVLFAVGAQYRDERLRITQTASSFTPSRNVYAGFTELHIPLVGPATSEASSRLALTLADRLEHYSDFGNTNNPKAALVWRPFSSFSLRGTWGTSFKAPLLNDLNPTPTTVGAVQNFDPTVGHDVDVIARFGGNPDLGPEKARSWTAGFDFRPEPLPGMKFVVTYYDVRVKDRISNANSQNINVFNALASQSILGPSIIYRNPPASRVQELASFPGFLDLVPGGVNLNQIAAILNFNQQNLSVVETNGVDFDVSNLWTLGDSHLEAGVNGTYIHDFRLRFTSQAPVVSVVSTPFYPVDLRLRARLVLTYGGVTAGAFVNFTNSYTDNRGVSSVPVASWATLDANLQYAFPEAPGVLSGVSIALKVLNLTDAAPPFVVTNNPVEYPGINFDGTNANALGRFVSLQLAKRF